MCSQQFLAHARFIFSENAAYKDSYRRQCRRNRLLRSLPTLTSVRILTDSVLSRENKRASAPCCRCSTGMRWQRGGRGDARRRLERTRSSSARGRGAGWRSGWCWPRGRGWRLASRAGRSRRLRCPGPVLPAGESPALTSAHPPPTHPGGRCAPMALSRRFRIVGSSTAAEAGGARGGGGHTSR